MDTAQKSHAHFWQDKIFRNQSTRYFFKYNATVYAVSSVGAVYYEPVSEWEQVLVWVSEANLNHQ